MPPSAPKCGTDETTLAPKLLDLALALSHLAFVPTSAAPIHGPSASIFLCRLAWLANHKSLNFEFRQWPDYEPRHSLIERLPDLLDVSQLVPLPPVETGADTQAVQLFQ